MSPPPDPLPVSVIAVTFNSAHCIARAPSSVPDALERIVVDNASEDQSCEVAAPFANEVIGNARNVGFGTACNVGVRRASGEFLLFLNPDAALAPNALQRLVAAARQFPDAVAFGARGELPHAGDVGPGDLNQLRRAEKKRGPAGRQAAGGGVARITGAALLCRASVFRDIGGFDEHFFLYFEDEDLCRRLAERGPLMLVEEAVCYHLPGTGARLTPCQRFVKYRHYGHSRVHFGRKHQTGFRPLGAAAEQTVKGIVALVLADVGRSAQHFGRALGYFEGGLRRR